MIKTTKKLALTRQHIKVLSPRTLAVVDGGGRTNNCGGGWEGGFACTKGDSGCTDGLYATRCC